ncbi:MAG: beta-lactamase [Verrucomicrobia bacterium]|nr:beta-lactamase [Verrucomicrobiota bacterium]
MPILPVSGRTFAAVTLALLVSPSLPGAEPPAAWRQAVDAAVQPLLKEHDAPGVAIGLTVGGRAEFFCYGVTARQDGRPVTPRTLFEIGSVSKTFTATLGAVAEQRGRLRWSDHPSKFASELQGAPVDAATLLHLATYTAGGLPLQLPAQVKSLPDFFAYLRAWQPEAAPGVQRRYSNGSIGLFGHLAGVALGGDYAAQLQREVLRPLGLGHTYLRVPEAAMADYAWGHDGEKPIRVGRGVFDLEAYGVKTCAEDLVRYLEAQMDPSKLASPLREAIAATQLGHFRVGEMVQGLGWEQYPYPTPLERLLAGNSSEISQKPNPASALVPPRAPEGPTLFNKTGATNGFSAYVLHVPARRIGIVVLTNRFVPGPARITAAHALLTTLDAEQKGR